MSNPSAPTGPGGNFASVLAGRLVDARRMGKSYRVRNSSGRERGCSCCANTTALRRVGGSLPDQAGDRGAVERLHEGRDAAPDGAIKLALDRRDRLIRHDLIERTARLEAR